MKIKKKIHKPLIEKTSNGFRVYKVSGGSYRQQLKNGIKVVEIEKVKTSDSDPGTFKRHTKQKFRTYNKKRN